MKIAEFRFRFHPVDRSTEMDAYDASQALYGISRSLAVFSHYAINERVIKQAPALQGARVLVKPPVAGSFEFIVPIIQMLSEQPQSSVEINVLSNMIYDLGKTTFGRLTGKSDTPKTDRLLAISRSRAGDLDAIADTVSEDVNRIHRPIINNVTNINIYVGTNTLETFNRDTLEYARTKRISDREDEFLGHITSYNANGVQGRIRLETEDRTVGFSVNRGSKLRQIEKNSLAWSLQQWVAGVPGFVTLTGFALTSKQGLLKHIYVTEVLRG